MTQDQAIIPFTECNDWNVVFRDSVSGAVVLFNRENKQLSLYRNIKGSLVQKPGTTFCPLCYRPFQANDLHSTFDESSLMLQTFIDSGYFRFLENFTWDDAEKPLDISQPLSSPSPTNSSLPGFSPSTSTPLSSLSFNQGYFKRFFIPEGSLGRGSRGEVLKVLHVLDGVPLGHYAVKRIPVGDSHSWLKKLLKEVHLLRLRHTNLVNYNHLTKFGPTVPVLYILQEYCDRGDLESFVQELLVSNEPTFFDLKKKVKRLKAKPFFIKSGNDIVLPLGMVISFIKDIASGLSFLHENNLIHRDLKPGNCLLQSTKNGFFPRVLVSDFGESQVATEVESRSGGTGTLEYTAPEVLFTGEDGKPKGFFTPASDIFSLGLILYWLLFTGKLPYEHSAEEYDKLRAEILNFKGYQHQPKTSNAPEDLCMFLETMLSPDPHKRPSSQEIVEFIIRILKKYCFQNILENDQPLQFNEYEESSRIMPVSSQESLAHQETKSRFSYNKNTHMKNKNLTFRSIYLFIFQLFQNFQSYVFDIKIIKCIKFIAKTVLIYYFMSYSSAI
ncbi:unnamed protein product [Pneumocystis jirovecii]|uniref:Protein kinase domain-containing protein n=1 Tax=Pneumocystis jirovecii TaxID=42068 RepID=L0PCS6_PNEJI|nr:unnamed protein product [Pneumocystis jirovecii]